MIYVKHPLRRRLKSPLGETLAPTSLSELQLARPRKHVNHLALFKDIYDRQEDLYIALNPPVLPISHLVYFQFILLSPATIYLNS